MPYCKVLVLEFDTDCYAHHIASCDCVGFECGDALGVVDESEVRRQGPSLVEWNDLVHVRFGDAVDMF